VTDRGPVFNQVNLVVRDMAAMVAFYERLGVELAPTVIPWDRHHRSFASNSMVDGFDFDLDSATFAQQWNEGWPPRQAGPVFGFRLASETAVDETYRDLTSAGYVGQQAPYDGFMGARYAVVVDPDGNSVGLMSPIDPSRRTIPPPPGD
jgi:catechol 2,3-dioxygenase-like lactoylglutathione lyase family enzyme